MRFTVLRSRTFDVFVFTIISTRLFPGSTVLNSVLTLSMILLVTLSSSVGFTSLVFTWKSSDVSPPLAPLPRRKIVAVDTSFTGCALHASLLREPHTTILSMEPDSSTTIPIT